MKWSPAERTFAHTILAAAESYGADILTGLKAAYVGIEGARIESSAMGSHPGVRRRGPLSVVDEMREGRARVIGEQLFD